MQGAEFAAHHEHDGVRVLVDERGGDPERGERGAASHEADVVPEDPGGESELLDDVDVGPGLREPGAGHSHQVCDGLRRDAGAFDGVASGGDEQRRGEFAVPVVA